MKLKELISRLTMKKSIVLTKSSAKAGAFYKDCYGDLWYANNRFGRREKVWHIGHSGISSKYED